MFTWLQNRENITFTIAIIGCVISIYNFTSSFLRSRTRIKISIPHVFRIKTYKGCTDVIHCKILNYSSNPVVISRLTVSNEECNGSFGMYRRNFFSTSVKRDTLVVEKKDWYSDNFPTKIEGNGCANLFLISDGKDPVLLSGKQNLVKLYTANKTVNYKLQFTDFSEIAKIAECREPN